jgi:uncharacterized protein YfeS
MCTKLLKISGLKMKIIIIDFIGKSWAVMYLSPGAKNKNTMVRNLQQSIEITMSILEIVQIIMVVHFGFQHVMQFIP